jgi:hypothetical protein
MDDNIKNTGTKDKTFSIWTCDDETALVCALKTAKDKGKWGDNNPKDSAWTVCVVARKNLKGYQRPPKLSSGDGSMYMLIHILHCMCIYYSSFS